MGKLAIISQEVQGAVVYCLSKYSDPEKVACSN
jgi:hypothetical protein